MFQLEPFVRSFRGELVFSAFSVISYSCVYGQVKFMF